MLSTSVHFAGRIFASREAILLLGWLMPPSQTIYYSVVETPIGKLLLAATELGLRCIHFGGHLPAQARNEIWVESPQALQPYQDQLRAYFLGELREFNFKLDLKGTDFQKKCWDALLHIPYGRTCSYAEIARRVGRPRAFRAVGQANHHNPIPIVVPCHRVVTSSGTLGGYGGGLDIKEKLLRLERAL